MQPAQAFLSQPTNVDQARLDLGKLFRIEDYPSKEALQGKFSIRYLWPALRPPRGGRLSARRFRPPTDGVRTAGPASAGATALNGAPL